MIRAREELLKLQQAIFYRLDEEVKAHQRNEGTFLRQYRRAYDREVQDFIKPSSKDELLEEVAKASIVYCGDFHTLRQAQRTPLKILRSVLLKRPSIFLALELIPQGFEKVTNDFIRKRISEKNFLDQIKYDDRWGFPWNHYRPLFHFARENNLRIIGLNSEEGDQASLTQRDQIAAEQIGKITLSNPTTLIFCLYGDLHLASSHIPRIVKRILAQQGAKRKTLTIFQNSEPIYWKLSSQELENQVDVVQVSTHAYCVLSAAPWMKWQSYLSWVEDQSDLLDSPTDTMDKEEMTPDYYHQILELAERIVTFLKLHPKELEHFSVLTSRDISIIDELERYCRACERRDFPVTAVIRSEIIENGSCFFPENSILYLHDLSENRAAEKAAQLICAKLTRELSVFGPNHTPQEIFYRLVLWEAVGYFGSKIINPKRKCDRYRDFERFLLQIRKLRVRGRMKDRKEVARAILSHRDYEYRRVRTGKKGGAPRKVYRLQHRIFFQTASALGRILADRLYYMMITEDLSMDIIRSLFSPFSQSQSATEFYWELAAIVQKQKFVQETKEDQF